ncbi:MAG: hypothetical protein ACMXYF_00935 [Candidatus Woesearchaeota archaeon]
MIFTSPFSPDMKLLMCAYESAHKNRMPIYELWRTQGLPQPHGFGISLNDLAQLCCGRCSNDDFAATTKKIVERERVQLLVSKEAWYVGQISPVYVARDFKKMCRAYEQLAVEIIEKWN